MKKIALIVLGIIVAVMGVLALIPGIGLGSEHVWHAIVKIVVGAAAAAIGFFRN